MRILTTALIMTVALLVVVPTKAQQPTLTEPVTVVEALSVEGVSSLLREIGAEEVTSPPDTTDITFVIGGAPLTAHLYSCQASASCVQMSIYVIVSGRFPLESINRFNSRTEQFVRAVRMNDESIAFVRTFMAYGGVTRANVAINVLAFAQSIGAFVQALAEPTVADNDAKSLGYKLVRIAPSNVAPMLQAAGAVDVYTTLRYQK